MASSPEFIDYACDRLQSAGELRAKKMFGDFLIYVNEKPVILACDNVLYLKMLPGLAGKLPFGTGFPYAGAKEHYILEPDAPEAADLVRLAESLIPPPKPKVKK